MVVVTDDNESMPPSMILWKWNSYSDLRYKYFSLLGK